MNKDHPLENRAGIFIGSGIVASFLASLCCIGPLVLTVLGISGAGVLAKFELLRLPFTILIFLLFGGTGYLLYRKRSHCEPGSICADPKKFKKMILAYWIGLFVALIALLSLYWIEVFF